jgi:hypothetical protein
LERERYCDCRNGQTLRSPPAEPGVYLLLITAKKGRSPKISSTEPKDQLVDAYLLHCGFYDYVNVKNDLNHIDTHIYDDSEIVKIQRKNNKSEIEIREKAVRSILQKYSSLTEDQIENFDCNVLIEAFNNVTEHGRNYGDNGWWTLTQYHKKTEVDPIFWIGF